MSVKSIKKSNLFTLLDDSDSENDNNKKIKEIKEIKEIKQNNITNKIEDEMFNQYYSKKNYSTNSKFNEKKPIKNINFDNNQNEFIKVSNKKKEKIIIDCKIIDFENDFEEKILDNYYTVLAHHNDDKNWDYLSYHNITILTKWNDISTFFNTLNIANGECKYTDFDIFLMKNNISPMWEDPENRNGSICSIKIDSMEDGYKIFKELMINTANHTLLKFNENTWDVVNGLSFSPKKIDNINLDSYCIFIKIWFKINILNFGPIEKILNDDIANYISKYSIKIKAIKPEY